MKKTTFFFFLRSFVVQNLRTLETVWFQNPKVIMWVWRCWKKWPTFGGEKNNRQNHWITNKTGYMSWLAVETWDPSEYTSGSHPNSQLFFTLVVLKYRSWGSGGKKSRDVFKKVLVHQQQFVPMIPVLSVQPSVVIVAVRVGVSVTIVTAICSLSFGL